MTYANRVTAQYPKTANWLEPYIQRRINQGIDVTVLQDLQQTGITGQGIPLYLAFVQDREQALNA